MIAKPDLKKNDTAIGWARMKYAEREKDLMGAVPPLEQFMIAVVELMAIQNKTLEAIHKDLEEIANRLREKV